MGKIGRSDANSKRETLKYTYIAVVPHPGGEENNVVFVSDDPSDLLGKIDNCVRGRHGYDDDEYENFVENIVVYEIPSSCQRFVIEPSVIKEILLELKPYT